MSLGNTVNIIIIIIIIIIIDFFHFSALAWKYSPIPGCSNQQDYARWSYL